MWDRGETMARQKHNGETMVRQWWDDMASQGWDNGETICKSRVRQWWDIGDTLVRHWWDNDETMVRWSPENVLWKSISVHFYFLHYLSPYHHHFPLTDLLQQLTKIELFDYGNMWRSHDTAVKSLLSTWHELVCPVERKRRNDCRDDKRGINYVTFSFFPLSFWILVPSNWLNNTLERESDGWMDLLLYINTYFPILQALSKFFWFKLEWLLLPHSHGLAWSPIYEHTNKTYETMEWVWVFTCCILINVILIMYFTNGTDSLNLVRDIWWEGIISLYDKHIIIHNYIDVYKQL